MKGFPLKHSSIKKDVPGRTTLKSLNQVIRELRAEKDNKDTTPVAKSGNFNISIVVMSLENNTGCLPNQGKIREMCFA